MTSSRDTVSVQPPDDAALVRRTLEGDTSAYEELIRRYQGKIYTLVYNMTAHKEDAEDIVQEVFVKAYRALRHFRGSSSFYTWLYRIAINRTINYLKKHRRAKALSLNDMDAGAERDPAYVELSAKGTPFRDATLTELQERLNKALQSLSEKHRTVVILHDIQGVPHEEIAKMIGCSQGTVRSRLFYARQRLQAELSEFAP